LGQKSLVLIIFIASCMLFSACGSSPEARDSTITPTITPVSPMTIVPQRIPSSTPIAIHIPQPDLSIRPLVFIGALPPPNGSLDFMNLFAEDSPWVSAAQHVQVYNLFGGWVAHFPWEPEEATDEELKQIISDLNRRGIAIGFEASPLVATDECGSGVEGFFGPEEGLKIVNRLSRLGAKVIYVSLDEPYVDAHIYDGPNACHWPPEKIAQQVHDYITAIKTVYPDVIVGDNEPLWKGVSVEDLTEWLDVYKAVTGTNLSFLHLDPDYSRLDWYTVAKQLEVASQTRGVDFGIFYFGNENDVTDLDWVNKAFERARMYELVAGGKPDHVIFESWHDRPDYLLPEDKPDTFTSLINRYFRTRTSLSMDISSMTEDGLQKVTGTLTTTEDPSHTDAGAEVEVTMKMVEGPGLVGEYTISGVVPPGAVLSDLGIRVNTECGCQGVSDLTIYEVSYLESEDKTNRVSNYDFSQGLDGWGSWGNAIDELQPSDNDDGLMLHIKSERDQTIGINSSPFRVNPGFAYTATFIARISPESFGSGYFDITFQNNTGEFKRETIPFESATIKIGSEKVDQQGYFETNEIILPPGKLIIEANYGGSGEYWPAYARIEYSSE
jgi:hypothetical protein